MTLVPNAPAPSGSYWCTWSTQNYALDLAGLGLPAVPASVEGAAGARLARDALDAERLFAADGWAVDHLAGARGDLLLLLDDGWDVPHGVDALPQSRGRFGSLLPDARRFPATGDASARLAALVANARGAGWAGLGVWLAVQPDTGGDEARSRTMPLADLETYWAERAALHEVAGVAYWKADWGHHSRSHAVRQLLSRLGRAHGITIEHASCQWALNDWLGSCRAAGQRWGETNDQTDDSLAMIGYSDVFRCYDILGQLATPTMLDRVATLLAAAPSDAPAVLNAEDEVYLGATLGCTLGVMRHPSWRLAAWRAHDPADTARRCREAVRAVRWQRLAPPRPAGAGRTLVDHHVLADHWAFTAEDTWFGKIVGREIEQRAPARVARDLALPTVDPVEGLPYVIASRHPNGATAIAALPRVAGRRIATPRARLTVKAETGHPLAMFGPCTALTLELDRAPVRVLAQDLAAETAEDITAATVRDGTRLTIPGAVFDRLALRGDASEPGTVIRAEA